ncbi:MAG TPA: NepR family anti-sigma factor [Sphingomicrobium sp.]|nr:NepR family anti-sigma factor [Sphingomicrobium sp.]
MSGSETGDSKGAAARAGGRSRKTPTGETKTKKQRAGDLGRALRTVYDDTLREPVPDDFVDLLGKLT